MPTTVLPLTGTNVQQVAAGPTTDPILNEAIRNSGTNPFLVQQWLRVKAQAQNEIQNAWAMGMKVPEELVKKAFCDGRVLNNGNMGLDTFVPQQQQQPQVIIINNGGQQPQVTTLPQVVTKPQVVSQPQPQIIVINNDDKKADDTAKTSSSSEDVSKLEELFKNIDTDGKDGISKDEFVNYYVKEMERRNNTRYTNENDPDLAKVKKEAENLFEALKNPKENNITKDRFDKIVKYYDKASDGKADGKYDIAYLAKDVDKIIKEGKDAKISGGKTLEENLEAIA